MHRLCTILGENVCLNFFIISDISYLGHPKVKLFITQGGLQSTDEAIAAKVPLVAVPMLGDQWSSAEKYVRFGIGMKLTWATITDENIRNAIETVIKDQR